MRPLDAGRARHRDSAPGVGEEVNAPASLRAPRRCLPAAAALLLALPAGALERYSLAVYHFNIQYVAGGLEGFPDGAGTDPDLNVGERELEDLIVVESLEPLLDIYLRHPTWGADVEMQGLMADVMRERHPAVLEKLRTLVSRGQLAVDSFHWSDQLWLAYPRRDMEVSFGLARDSLVRAGLEPGRATWTQEGQFGPGLERFLRERGQEIAIVPRNLFRWMRGAPADKPLYRLGDAGDVLCVVTTGAADGNVQTKWSFVDDGELAVTGRKNPYFGRRFVRDPDSIAALEAGLAADEAEGWHAVTVQAFARAAKAAGSVPEPLPSVLDGTWQPDDTANVHRWMGGSGLMSLLGAEDDNGVLAGNMRARRDVVDAEAVVLAAGRPELQPHVDEAWRELLLAEVSDSTGWNPFIGERRYSETHAAKAAAAARVVLDHPDVRERLRPVRPAPVLVDSDAPVDTQVTTTPERPWSMAWKTRQDGSSWEGVLSVGAAANAPTRVELAFARTHDKAVFSPALEDGTVVEHELASFAAAEQSLPLANGLVGLGDDRFLVLRTDSLHLAALLPKDRRVVRFLDMTSPAEPFEWRFVVVQGTREEALSEANTLNVAAARALGPPPEGCGCAGGGGPAALVACGAAAGLRRRRMGRMRMKDHRDRVLAVLHPSSLQYEGQRHHRRESGRERQQQLSLGGGAAVQVGQQSRDGHVQKAARAEGERQRGKLPRVQACPRLRGEEDRASDAHHRPQRGRGPEHRGRTCSGPHENRPQGEGARALVRHDGQEHPRRRRRVVRHRAQRHAVPERVQRQP